MRDLVFELGKPVAVEESLTCEFKEVTGSAVQAVSKDVDKYAVAYLNECGGSVYWGIRNSDRRVVGVRLDSTAKDQVLQVIGQKIAAIAPPVSSEWYEVPFHPVVHPEHNTTVNDTFVLELSVRKPNDGWLFLTGSGVAYRKTLAGAKKLTGAELYTALISQLKRKHTEAMQEKEMAGVDIPWMSSLARRAKLVRPLLAGARALWVDDNPSNNLYERVVLTSLGVSVDVAVSTEEAMYMATRVPYDLVLSDMARGSDATAGIRFLNWLKKHGLRIPVVFYIGYVDPNRPIPAGAFGLTNRPDELLHYAFDVLERRDPKSS